MLEKDCNCYPISTFSPCYAFQMIFTALAPRLNQSIGRKVHNKNRALKRLCHLSPRFYTLKDLLPWIGEQQYIETDVWQFSRKAGMCVIPGKLLKICFHALFFLNPGEKFLNDTEIACSQALRVWVWVWVYLKLLHLNYLV